jgi:tetratricopeptide (TPR) repeat protein
VHGTLITSVHSAADGSFNLSNLPTGRYEVTASSGVEQARERVEVGRIGETTVDLLLSNKTPTGNTSDSSISFAQYKVPAKARSLYEKAVQFMARDKFDEALEKVNASLDIFPKFAEALTLHGVIQERAGKSEAAIADYRLAIQSDPKYPLPYITMASVLNSTGRFAESLSFLGQAEHIAPNMWQISYESARSSLGKDDFAAALRSIDRASELHGGTLKETAEMHLVRGYALIGLSNVQKAKDEVQAFLTREPKGHVADDAREVLRRLDNGTMSASN